MNLKATTQTLIIAAVLAGSLFATSVALADTFDEINRGFQTTGQEAGFPVESDGTPKKEFINAWVIYINGFFVSIGLLFMVLVIYGGWLWMTARGEEEKVRRGKNLIIQATIGIGIILASRLMVEVAITVLGETVVTAAP